MYELLNNGVLVGLFPSEEAAKKYAKDNDFGTYCILPPSTMTVQENGSILF